MSSPPTSQPPVMNVIDASATPLLISQADVFEPYSISKLLRGTSLYNFREYYELISLLLKSDQHQGYLNYGFWEDGELTANPPAAMIKRLTERLKLDNHSSLLNVGSGLGRADLDIYQQAQPERIISININVPQLEYAKQQKERLLPDAPIEYRLINAENVARALPRTQVSHVLGCQLINELDSIATFLKQAHTLLKPGGRIVLSGLVTLPSKASTNRTSTLEELGLMATESALGYRWQELRQLQLALERHGFIRCKTEKIGYRVIPYTWQYAKSQFGTVLARKDLPRSARSMAVAATATLTGLHKAQRIEYVILSAERDHS